MANNTFSLADLGAAPASSQTPSEARNRRRGLVGSSVKGELPQDDSLFSTITSAADRYGVPHEIALALAQQESSYRTDARNTEFGAAGLYQFIPETAKAHGIDPLDPEQSSDAAMRDFAKAMDEQGIDWAIKHHFAGPNIRGHGPKTKQYLADVSKRAKDIKALLEGRTSGVGGSTEEGPRQVVGGGDNSFSLADLEGIDLTAAPAPVLTPPAAKPLEGNAITRAGGHIADAASKGFQHVLQRLKDSPDEYMGEKLIQVERSPAEIDALVAEANKPSFLGIGQKQGPMLGRESWEKDFRERMRYTIIPQQSAENEVKEIEARAAARAKPQERGFLANLGNIGDLITSESLPANAIEALARAPKHEREAFNKARQVAMQERIVANPQNFPDVSVQAAQREIDKRKAKQDPTIRQMWNDLKAAAKEDPGNFGAQFANALMADPELLFAPVGLGTRVASTTKAMVTASTAGKAAKIADKLIDAGSVEAVLNLGIEATKKASEGESITSAEATQAAVIGAAIGGPLGLLFSRGAASRATLRKKNTGELGADDLETAIRDVAKEDLAVEQVIENPDSIDLTTRTRIEEMLGITHMSAAEKRKWHTRKQRELKTTLEEHSSDLEYNQFKADERIQRAQQFQEEQAAREAQAKAAAAKDSTVDTAWAQHEAGRVAGLREAYDEALQARESLDISDKHTAAIAEDRVRELTNKIDQEEIIEAAFESAPAIERAMNSALRRDANLRTPKWQRGEVDPKLLARGGAAGLFAGTAFALAPEGKKEEAAFAAGLAALMIPGGGSVLSRLRQSGSVSMDGSIPGLAELVANGKLKPDVDIPAAKAREADLLTRAKAGDTKAQSDIYTEHFPRVERFLKTFVREAGPKLGVDAEDVAQEVFIKFFQGLDKFRGESGIYTYLQSIARNEGLMAVRTARNLKGGGEYQIGSMYSPVGDAGESLASGHIMDGSTPLVKGEVETASADFESPEFQVLYDDAQKRMLAAVKGLPEAQQAVFLLNKVDEMPLQDIADKLNMPLGTVKVYLMRATDTVTELIEKDFSAKKMPRKTVAPVQELDPATGQPVVKRGRGRPRKNQTGEIDPRLLKAGGIATLGAGAGAYLNEENRMGGALMGALVAVGATTLRGKSGKTGVDHITNVADYTLGITSTRIKNIAEPVWRKAIEYERLVLKRTHNYLSSVSPFLRELGKLPEETQGILTRAILTGNARVTDRLLTVLSNDKLSAGWKDVRGTLDSLQDQLIHLKRFAKGDFEYFPRMVKDVPGLLKALGRERASFIEEALKDANTKSISNRGTGLTELEEAKIINTILSTQSKASQQPGFAKNRGVEEITPELQKFYHSPTESLHSYIRSAVEDIERAKFFGKDLEVITKGGKHYTNVDKSVGHIVNRLMKEGKVTPEQAEEVGKLLKSRFTSGERSPHEVIQHAKNLAYAGLLGSPFSAATQLGDVVIQMFTQDTRSVLYALAKQLRGKQAVRMKDFGLTDHIAEEFSSTTSSAKALRFIMATSLFKGVDHFGKDIALNAAIIRYGRLAKSERGIQEITRRYGDALAPGELKQLIADLQKGEVTDLVESIAFAELSRSQPITRLEMPQAYLDHPNGRVAYMLKTFMLKQLDIARREGLDEIRKGNFAKGFRNITELGIILGIAGTSTDIIKDFMLGKEVDLKATDIAENAFKTFGISKYFMDQFAGVSKEEAKERREGGEAFVRPQAAKPIRALGGMAIPPAKMFDEIVTLDPKAIRYIPWVGPYLSEKAKQQKEKDRNKNSRGTRQ